MQDTPGLGRASLASASSGALAGKGRSRSRSTPIPLHQERRTTEQYRGPPLLTKNTSSHVCPLSRPHTGLEHRREELACRVELPRSRPNVRGGGKVREVPSALLWAGGLLSRRGGSSMPAWKHPNRRASFRTHRSSRHDPASHRLSTRPSHRIRQSRGTSLIPRSRRLRGHRSFRPSRIADPVGPPASSSRSSMRR